MDQSTATSQGQVPAATEVRPEPRTHEGSRAAIATQNGKAELQMLHRVREAGSPGHGMLSARGQRLPTDFDVACLLAPCSA